MTPGGSVGVGTIGEAVSKLLLGGGVFTGAKLSCSAGGSDFSSL